MGSAGTQTTDARPPLPKKKLDKGWSPVVEFLLPAVGSAPPPWVAPPTAKKETRQKGGAFVDEFLLPAVGLEPTRPRGQQILSLPCMPFHHAGVLMFVLRGHAGRQGNTLPYSKVDLTLGVSGSSVLGDGG